MDSIARDLLHCKICIQILYEPFINPCGHTYCYSCLVQWFDNNSEGRRLTCPECRQVIETAPAPNYLIRQMVHKLIQLPQFCDDDETPESHQNAQAEEAALVEHDRASLQGLFKGRFDRAMLRNRMARIRDIEDGVERCPHCAWEIEDDESDVCLHCGVSIADAWADENGAMLLDEIGYDSAMDEEDENEDEEVDEEFGVDDESDFTEQLGFQRGLPDLSRRGFVPARNIPRHPINVGERHTEPHSDRSSDAGMGYAEDDDDDDEAESDEEEDDEDDEDTSMDGFIEPDDGEDSGSESESSSTSGPPESEAPDYEDADGNGSDDDEELETPRESPAPVAPAPPVRHRSNANKRQRAARPVVIDSSDESSEDEGGPVRARRRQRGTAGRPVRLD